MNLTNLPGPDSVIKSLLVGIFGPTAAIVTIFAIANFLWSWLGVARSGFRLGQKVVATSTRVLARRPVTTVMGALLTVWLLVLQAVWLWTAYRIANGLAYLWDAPFGRGNPQWSGLVSYVRWDWISTSYLLASIGALIWCYVFAFGHGESDAVDRSTTILLLPLALPWGAACLIGSVLALLDFGLHRITDHTFPMPENGWTFIVVTLIVIAYAIAASTALRSTMTFARIWRTL